jgi:hypothetical protein
LVEKLNEGYSGKFIFTVFILIILCILNSNMFVSIEEWNPLIVDAKPGSACVYSSKKRTIDGIVSEIFNLTSQLTNFVIS